MKLIDTNVFIYAVGEPHVYKESCATLMAKLETGEEAANIDSELLQEILYYFWRRRRHGEGAGLFDRLVAGFPDAFPITVAEVRRARELLGAQPLIEPRDAIHAAVVLTHGLEGIISADRGFDAIPGIRRFDPIELVKGS